MLRKRHIFLMISAILMCGCGVRSGETKNQNNTDISEKTEGTAEQEDSGKTEEIISGEPEKVPCRYSTWVAYWDHDSAMEEAHAFGDSLDSVAAFEAMYTGTENDLWIPDETRAVLQELQDNFLGEKKIYLSIVNDYRNEDGSYSQKDVTLLEKVLMTEESRSKCVQEAIQLARECGTDGIELDFENLKRTENMQDNYAALVRQLGEAAEANDLLFRVDVEYQMPELVDLPREYQYVVMCYNLFGQGTAPGPKADEEFLKKCCEIYKEFPDVMMAFGTGGYQWGSDGSFLEVTEQEAMGLFAQKCGAWDCLKRDDGSQDAYFEYVENGVNYQVWYADAETLKFWKKTVTDQGIAQIALWRMDGNDPDTIARVVAD